MDILACPPGSKRYPPGNHFEPQCCRRPVALSDLSKTIEVYRLIQPHTPPLPSLRHLAELHAVAAQDQFHIPQLVERRSVDLTSSAEIRLAGNQTIILRPTG
jgi:hypothetical protein